MRLTLFLLCVAATVGGCGKSAPPSVDGKASTDIPPSTRPGARKAHVERKRFYDACELRSWSSVVVRAETLSWGPPQDLTFAGYPNAYPFSPVQIRVLEVVAGQLLQGSAEIWVMLGLTPDGDSADGRLANAKGLFFLKNMDGKLVLLTGGFFSEANEDQFHRGENRETIAGARLRDLIAGKGCP